MVVSQEAAPTLGPVRTVVREAEPGGLVSDLLNTQTLIPPTSVNPSQQTGTKLRNPARLGCPKKEQQL